MRYKPILCLLSALLLGAAGTVARAETPADTLVIAGEWSKRDHGGKWADAIARNGKRTTSREAA